MASIFTKIINGEIPSFKVAENNSCYAFLDIAPLKKGHVLVVPKKDTTVIVRDSGWYGGGIYFSPDLDTALT